jgi:hypothetical protein
MKNLVQKTAHDLKTKTEIWVNREFNFISQDLLSSALENKGEMLLDYIRPAGLESEEYFNSLPVDEQHELMNESGLFEDVLGEDWQFLPILVLDPFDKSENYGQDFEDWMEEEQESEIRDWMDSNGYEHYPCWNTLFEFRHQPSEDVLQAATEAGFGVIEETEFTNTCLFVSGAGYSFYSAHWIPMWLSLPWNESGREDFKGVDFQGQ